MCHHASSLVILKAVELQAPVCLWEPKLGVRVFLQGNGCTSIFKAGALSLQLRKHGGNPVSFQVAQPSSSSHTFLFFMELGGADGFWEGK